MRVSNSHAPQDVYWRGRQAVCIKSTTFYNVIRRWLDITITICVSRIQILTACLHIRRDYKDHLSMTISIISTPLGFKRVGCHCIAFTICIKLVLLRPEPNPFQKNYNFQLRTRSIMLMKRKAMIMLNMIESSKTFVWWCQIHATERWRVCMCEKGRSSKLGEFYMAFENILYSVYVLCKSTTNDFIAHT